MLRNEAGGRYATSERTQVIPQALSVYINQLVYDLKRKNRDVITLSLGEAFFDIPRFSFDPLDFERGYHYSDSQGIPELRDKIAAFNNRVYGASIDGQENILISAGSKIIILMCMQAVLDPGDEVLIHEPAWLSYQEQARLCGGTVSFIPYFTDVAGFETYFTDRTKILIINNPNNPAGWIYPPEALRDLARLCQQRSVFLLVDEAYSDFVLDDEFSSITKVVPDLEGIIAVNSLSKNMGLSGWRVGYAIAEGSFIQQLLKLNQHLITCAPTILQIYLARYFDDILACTIPQARQVVEKRQAVARRLEEVGVSCLAGSSTFYFFLDCSAFDGDVFDLALYMLLEHDVAMVPGAAYGASTSRFVRMSIGTESEERIEHAIRVLKQTIAADIDPAYVVSELRRHGLPSFQSGEDNARS